jgi:head-tail adaptor
VIPAGERDRLIIFNRSVTVRDGYGQRIPEASSELTRAMARVKFGTSQEKREAAQESALQSATFECVITAQLRGVKMIDTIAYDGSNWNITEKADLDRETIRFTATRSK